MRLTLSFDNGPVSSVTPRVLDTLAHHGVTAHFFVLGRCLEAPEGRALVARALAEGHHVGNHSYTHQTPLGDDTRDDLVAREIVDTETRLAPLLGDRARTFRPFGGGGVIGPHLLRDDALAHLAAQGYSVVLWNSVPRDWEDPAGWPATALADLEQRPHTLLVLHDIPGACLDGLDGFLTAVKARGHTLTDALPDDCVPLVNGRARADLSALVRPRTGAAVKGSP